MVGYDRRQSYLRDYQGFLSNYLFMRQLFFLNGIWWINNRSLEICYKELLCDISMRLPRNALDNVGDLVIAFTLPCLPDAVREDMRIMGGVTTILLSGWLKFFIRYLNSSRWMTTDNSRFYRDESNVITGIFRIYEFFSELYGPEKPVYVDKNKQQDIRNKLDFLKHLSTQPFASWYEPVREEIKVNDGVCLRLARNICNTIKDFKKDGGELVLYGSGACFHDLFRTVSSFKKKQPDWVLRSPICFVLNDFDFYVGSAEMQNTLLNKLKANCESRVLHCAKSEMCLFIPTASGSTEMLNVGSLVFFDQSGSLLKLNVNHISDALVNEFGFSSVEKPMWSPYFFKDDKVFYNFRSLVQISVLDHKSLESMILYNLSCTDCIRHIKDLIHLIPLCLSEHQVKRSKGKPWQAFVRSCISSELI